MQRRSFLLGTVAAITAPALPQHPGLRYVPEMEFGVIPNRVFPDKIFYVSTPTSPEISLFEKFYRENSGQDWETLTLPDMASGVSAGTVIYDDPLYSVGTDMGSGPSESVWAEYHKIDGEIRMQIIDATGIRFDHLANSGVLAIA